MRELVATADERRREGVRTVRVIEYALDDPAGRAPRTPPTGCCPLCSTPRPPPAGELAALYAQRWEIESIFDELKTHQRGPRVILRSRTFAGIYQEAWGYLCVHYALRALIHAAADNHDLDPDRISITTALHAACAASAPA